MKLKVLMAYWKLKRAAKRLERAKTMEKKYSAATTLWKALITFLVTLGATNAAVLSAVETPATWEQFKAQWPTLLISLIVAALKACANWRKNKDKKEDTAHPLVPSASIILLCALTGFMGCKTWIDAAGARHFAADWEIISQSREQLQPYVKEGVAMALRYYEAKQADKEAQKAQCMRRAALLGAAVAFANEYRTKQDIAQAKEAANVVLVFPFLSLLLVHSSRRGMTSNFRPIGAVICRASVVLLAPTTPLPTATQTELANRVLCNAPCDGSVRDQVFGPSFAVSFSRNPAIAAIDPGFINRTQLTHAHTTTAIARSSTPAEIFQSNNHHLLNNATISAPK